MSEAIFNAYAPKEWRAESAGARPAQEINRGVVELLSEIGIQIVPKQPRLVSPEMIAKAWRVVTFGCLDQCPAGAKEKSEDWPIPGATDKTPQELRLIRDELSRRITTLIAEIQRSERTGS